MEKESYSNLVKKASPPSHKVKDFIFAFVIGGLICVLGQLLFEVYVNCVSDEKTAYGLVSTTIIFITALATGLKLFEKLAKHAGAGTLVPISGFANSVTAPAIEFKTEGLVLGLGAKMFIIAGPVIVYGVLASVIYGVVYWICTLI